MRDKVVSELARQAGGLRNTWPFSLCCASPPNFSYVDHNGQARETRLYAKPAQEPNDYMWPNLFVRHRRRSRRQVYGYFASLLFVVGCTVLALSLIHI